MRISKNFTMDEFSVSASYPHLAKGVPINLQDNVKELVLKVLQHLCDKGGWTCIIGSGYRSVELNRAIGGTPTSQHLKAEAADCVFKKYGKPVPIIDVLRLATAMNLPFDQMIAYPTFVHLSYTRMRQNRKMVLYNKSYKGKRL